MEIGNIGGKNSIKVLRLLILKLESSYSQR